MAATTQKQEEVIRELKQLSEDTLDEISDFIKFLKIRDSDVVDASFGSEVLLEEEWIESEEDKAWE